MLFGVWFPGGSILGLILLCHLEVGEVCGPATPNSSAEFLIQLAFAWLSPTVLVLVSGPARIFSVFCGCIYWLPDFTTVKQNGLYIGIEDPDFGVIGVCCRSPDCIERSEHASGSLNSFCHISVCTSIVLTDYATQAGKFWYLFNLLVIKKEWLVVGDVDAYFFCFADIDFQADFGSFAVQSLHFCPHVVERVCQQTYIIRVVESF